MKIKDFSILLASEKRYFFLVLLLSLCVSVVEAFFAKTLFAILTESNVQEFAYYLLVLLLVSKIGVSMTLTWLQVDLSYKIQYDLSLSIALSYKNSIQDYRVFNKSAFTRQVLLDNEIVAGSFILPMLFLISEALILLGLLIYLAINISLTSFLSISLLVFFALSISHMLRGVLLRFANEKIFHSEKRAGFFGVYFDGMKELYVSGAAFKLEEKIREIHNRLVKINTYHQLLTATPRFALELIVYGSLAVVVLVLNSPDERMTFITLMGVIGLRVMPNLNRLVNSINQVRFGAPFIEEFNDAIKRNSISTVNKIQVLEDDEYALMITLGQGKPTIKVKFGETLRIAGPSGRGKTSLVLAMIGAGAPVNNLDVRWNKKLVKEGVLENACLIGQEPFFLPGTIQDNIELLVESCNIDFVVSASKIMGLHLEKSDLSRNISTLSGGERQKLAIAMSYCNDKSVYIFDESTNSLHESEANQLINYVAGREQSVLLYISHQNIRVNNEFELSIA